MQISIGPRICYLPNQHSRHQAGCTDNKPLRRRRKTTKYATYNVLGARTFGFSNFGGGSFHAHIHFLGASLKLIPPSYAQNKFWPDPKWLNEESVSISFPECFECSALSERENSRNSETSSFLELSSRAAEWHEWFPKRPKLTEFGTCCGMPSSNCHNCLGVMLGPSKFNFRVRIFTAPARKLPLHVLRNLTSTA